MTHICIIVSGRDKRNEVPRRSEEDFARKDLTVQQNSYAFNNTFQ